MHHFSLQLQETAIGHRFFKIFALLLIIIFQTPALQAQQHIQGKIIDADTGLPVIGAHISIPGSNINALSDTAGVFSIQSKTPAATLSIQCMGYKTLTSPATPHKTYRLFPDIFQLKDVIITAVESRDVTVSSKIGKEAISHIQPSSFADLMELLPGGRSIDPAFSKAQIINLRAAGSLNERYLTSALGTKFILDGKPLNNNANLQYTPAFSSYGSDYVNAGTDMRTISTEDIESVDIIRGIPSAEYGDLTSGLIKITRKQGGNDISARFKADMKSKLFYIGKNNEWGTTDKLTMNAGLNYLDSKADPRQLRQNYKRLTASYRIGKTWSRGDSFRYSIHSNLDYSGSFDNEKADKDTDLADGSKRPIETYRSSYQRFSLGANFTLSSKHSDTFFRQLLIHSSLTHEQDLIDRWKLVSNGVETAVSVSDTPGEHDALILPAKYESSIKVDGKPFYGHFSITSNFNKKQKHAEHKFKIGAEWNMEKNYGKGLIHNATIPFSKNMNARQRKYSDIPALHHLDAFAEYHPKVKIQDFSLECLAGVRISSLRNIGSAYAIQGKAYLEPRFNLRLSLPQVLLNGHKLSAALFGGFGIHHKFPTLDQLFPEDIYGDIQQLNYWPTNEKLRRIHLLVFKIRPVNFLLAPAQNRKFEIGADFQWNAFSLSVNYFHENMLSGFRTSSEYIRIPYKDYDESSINSSVLTAPPSLEGLPYSNETLLTSYGYTSNGSQTIKQGIEFTFHSKRIKALNTKITFNGAWFRTEYANSIAEYYRPSMIINNKQYPYIGLYDKNDGTLYETLNTTLMTDTQIPSLGLIFSASFQCQWYTGKQRKEMSNIPIAYIDQNLQKHSYGKAEETDGILQFLLRDYSPDLFRYETIPFSMGINLKITKKLYHDKASCSMFVNRLIDISPDYTVKNVTIRRDSIPYFGMELDFKF